VTLLLTSTAVAVAPAIPRGLPAEAGADLRPEARMILEAVEHGEAAPVAQITMLPPPVLRVWRRAVDKSTDSCAGRVDHIPIEEYVRGVVPYEWFPTWDAEALKAGAIAARTYAWYWQAKGGKYHCADIDDTTASQVYRDGRKASTDAAVAATQGQAILKDGALLMSEYSAENGDPTADGIKEPYCTGQARNGHGRGLCQWGTQRWATIEHRDALWMLAHYYPGTTVTAPTVPPPPPPHEDEGCAVAGLSGRHPSPWLVAIGAVALATRRRRRRS
jgi:MYXO-CTERM domain-containing protein